MEAESFLDKIRPPRLEDAGLEDCALPPESIKEAFLKAASAVRSIVSGEGRCVDDPWEDDSSDTLVGITEGVTAPSAGCASDKGLGLTETPGDEVVVVDGVSEKGYALVGGPALPESGGKACVEGLLQGLEIGEKSGGIFGKKGPNTDQAYVAENENNNNKEKKKPILAEGFAA